MRTYIYVDGENHFHRSVDYIRQLTGTPFGPAAFGSAAITSATNYSFPHSIDGRRFGFDSDLRFFRDCGVLQHYWGSDYSQAIVPGPEPAIYVGTINGNTDMLHQARERLRMMQFDPVIIEEPRPNYEQRRATLEQCKLLEKPKGVDIALVTRMVTDATANLYDRCFLFCSDADYMPAIKAVRQMGKVVYVFGYNDAIGLRSEFTYVPDKFLNLDSFINAAYRQNCQQICATLINLGVTVVPPKPVP